MKGAFDSIIAGIGNFFEFVKTIPGLIVEGFKNLLQFLFVPNETLSDAALMANDTGGDSPTTYIAQGRQILMNVVQDKFGFVENFKTAFNNFNTAGKPLEFHAAFMGKQINISLAWYEPYRERIRSGLSVVFWVACALSCFGLISNIFGIGLKSGVGGIYQDSVNNQQMDKFEGWFRGGGKR